MPDKLNKRLQLCVPASTMTNTPGEEAQCTNEVLFGEYVLETVSNDNSDAKWVHVEASRDSYTGYLLRRHLIPVNPDCTPVTHWVSARNTPIFPKAEIKSRIVQHLPFGARVSVSDSSCLPFYQLDTGGYIWAQHLHDVKTPMSTDPVSLAKTHFLGAPYVWGGCTPQGVDCSGLVQALATALGHNIPRDSGDQELALSVNISPDKRLDGDIVYWPGHTGILVTQDLILHATAHSLNCVIEPLNNVVERAGAISSIKRLFQRG